MHYIAIKITQITVYYMTIFAPTCFDPLGSSRIETCRSKYCHIIDCYLCNFNSNIVHLLVLLNKYVKNARCNNQRNSTICFAVSTSLAKAAQVTSEM